MSNYRHRFVSTEEKNLPVGKVVCVGRNYAAHARELNNPIADEPVLFIKPGDCVVDFESPITIPGGRGDVHHEVELTVLIGEAITAGASPQDCLSAIAGVGIGLDLTLRDIQAGLKEKRQPWEKAKVFFGACVLSPFVAPASFDGLADDAAVRFTLFKNDQIAQAGCSEEMLWPVSALLAYISEWFVLRPGDVVMTGTPSGVGPLSDGDRISVELDSVLRCEAVVRST